MLKIYTYEYFRLTVLYQFLNYTTLNYLVSSACTNHNAKLKQKRGLIPLSSIELRDDIIVIYKCIYNVSWPPFSFMLSSTYLKFSLFCNDCNGTACNIDIIGNYINWSSNLLLLWNQLAWKCIFFVIIICKPKKTQTNEFRNSSFAAKNQNRYLKLICSWSYYSHSS